MKTNDKVISKMNEYVNKHIPSIKRTDKVEVTINDIGDLEFHYYKDGTVIQYCNTINHSYTKDYKTIFSNRNILDPDYHKNQVIEYRNHDIRLITLFDITCNNHVWWNSEFFLDIADGVLPLDEDMFMDLFDDGYLYYVLDSRFSTFENFYYKDRFELAVDIGEPNLYVWGKSNVLSISCYYNDILKKEWHRYTPVNEQIMRVLSRGYYCFYDCGEQLLRLKK